MWGAPENKIRPRDAAAANIKSKIEFALVAASMVFYVRGPHDKTHNAESYHYIR